MWTLMYLLRDLCLTLFMIALIFKKMRITKIRDSLVWFSFNDLFKRHFKVELLLSFDPWTNLRSFIPLLIYRFESPNKHKRDQYDMNTRKLFKESRM